jgi:hypothetical protein
MSLTTPQAFTSFLESISATDYQKDTFIPNRKASVDRDLAEGFPPGSEMPFSRGLLMGSAKKNTIIRPIDDIDVLAVFSAENGAWTKYQFDSKSFIYRVRKVYDGFHTQQVGARGQAVRVFYQTGGHVDVAPVFDNGDGVFLLPAGDGSWIRTAPTKANDWFSAQNAALGYNLAPLVRLLKCWNRAHSKRLRSFHLETMAAHTFSSLGSNRRDALQKFFQWGSSNLDVSDPGGQGGSLSSYLGWGARTEVTNSFSTASDRALAAIAAENSGDHEEAKRLWRIVLGNDFPS